MTLVEHLRELRSRLVKAFLAIGLGAVVGWIYYEQLFDFLRRPFDEARASLIESGDLDPTLAITGIGQAFTLQVKISILAGVVLAAPVWLYQLWAFVTPGLHRNERRWSLLFVAISAPLFLLGVWVSYLVLPKAMDILLGFTPEGVTNIIGINEYFSFVLRITLVFGFAFLLPVFIVMLNAVGVLSAARLGSWWRGITFGIFVFAAVATPTPDPWTMLILAAPMVGLTLVAFSIAWLNDRRRARHSTEPDYAELGDDETSVIDDAGSRIEPSAVQPVQADPNG